MRYIIPLCLFLILGFKSLIAQVWLTDLEQAKVAATVKDQDIVLVFEGSDWCAPCIRLNRQVLDTPDFLTYARDHYILLKADFPRKRKNQLSSEQEQKNIQLAETYNKEGYFPRVVVLDKTGSVLGETGYKNITPLEYIALLNSFMPAKSLLHIYKRVLRLMGSHFEITVTDTDSLKAMANIELAIDEIKRIENLISSWDPNSETSLINQNAGIHPVEVAHELFDLIDRSIRLAALSDGAFDISYAALDDIWKFDGSMINLPADQKIREALSKVGYKNIILDHANQTVFLRIPGMKIGFGGIGKGYAADMAKTLLISKGVAAGIISASGDMNTWGTQPSGKDWQVAISNPMNKHQAFALFPIKNSAVVTSGNYEKYLTVNGRRYSHIIDPRTGYPAQGIISATVFAPKAELADALATSLFVMGVETGLDRINQMVEVECIIISEAGDVFTSKNIEIKL